MLREEDPVPVATFAGRVVDAAGGGVAGARVGIVWSVEGPMYFFLLLRREAERRERPYSVTDGMFE